MNIKELAKQADDYADIQFSSDPEDLDDLIWCQIRDKKFAELVAAHEREECASIVENANTPDCGGWTANGIADAIRARSKA